MIRANVRTLCPDDSVTTDPLGRPVMSSTTHCLDAHELYERLDDLVVIDVRSASEFEAAHLPHSHNVPLDQLSARTSQVRDFIEAGREVVLVCRAGSRAHRAQEELVAAGLPQLPILEGGMLAWEKLDGPVVRDVIRWDLDRQVRLVVGTIVVLSIVLSVVFPPARFVAGLLGLGLVVSAMTNSCMLGMMLTKLPYNRPRTVVEGR